jgi:predicted nucleotidyltransferase
MECCHMGREYKLLVEGQILWNIRSIQEDDDDSEISPHIWEGVLETRNVTLKFEEPCAHQRKQAKLQQLQNQSQDWEFE